MQTTKNQHIIPKFYFKKFADKTGKFWVLDIPHNRINKPISWSQPCHEEYYFAIKTGEYEEVSQDIEKYFKDKFEDLTSSNYDRIVDEIINNKSLDKKDLLILSKLVAMLWIRSRVFRENIKSNIKQISEITYSDSKKVDEVTKEENNIYHLNMIFKINKYINLFFNKKWRFYLSDNNFITSDNPVVDLIYNDYEQKIAKKFLNKRDQLIFFTPKVWLKDSILLRKQIIALTPKITAVLISPDFPGKQVLRRKCDNDLEEFINYIRANNSFGYCYSQKRENIEKMFNYREAIIQYLFK